ncbi:MAG: late competence development ComFB family protein [Nitrospirae bacterium]|nr:late competence development ComFB family protein [Nitrospirota bacterium]
MKGPVDIRVPVNNEQSQLLLCIRHVSSIYQASTKNNRAKCDIAAIAFNYLPPHYIVKTDVGKEYDSPWVMVETAVTEAIDRIMERPNHRRRKPQIKPI